MHGVNQIGRSDRLAMAFALALAVSIIILVPDRTVAAEHSLAPHTPSSAIDANRLAPASIPAADPAASAPVVVDGVPVPEPASVPPPTIQDIVAPALAKGDATDAPVVASLRNLITSERLGSIVQRRNERQALEAFYTARNFAPLWIEHGVPNQRAKEAKRHLNAASLDGLDPNDYPTPKFEGVADRAGLAEAEIKLTAAILTYARHTQSGRVHFSRVHSDISYELAVPNPPDILASIATGEPIAESLARFNPPHAGYRALKEKLGTLRQEENESDPIRIPAGPILRPGMADPRIPLLREKLRIAANPSSTTYDHTLVEAVKRFQSTANITSDGLVGPQTLRALNRERRSRQIDLIVANMERWRWMPRSLGESYSILNVPDYSMKVISDGKVIWQTKVVVGKRSTPTPILSDKMQSVTVNPTWNVPPSILQNEYLPALRRDPALLDRIGIKVVRNRDGSIRMYQPPGDSNALGRLRFNFPNKFLVYQHDTPDRHLFGRTVRAYSNGCMACTRFL